MALYQRIAKVTAKCPRDDYRCMMRSQRRAASARLLVKVLAEHMWRPE